MSEHEESTAGAQLIATGKTVVSSQIGDMRSIAVVAPRNPDDVLRRCMYEVERVQEWAENGFYDRPIGDGKRVQGVSVTLTRILSRNWGNCNVRSHLVGVTGEDAGEVYQMGAVFIDLETNFALERIYPVSVMAWRRDEGYVLLQGEKLMQALLIGASKAERNVVSAGLPDWLVETVYLHCRKIAADSTRKQMGAVVQWFQSLGVTREQLERAVDADDLYKLNEDQLGRLRGIKNALRDGELKASELGAVDDEVSEASDTATLDDVLGAGASKTGGRGPESDDLADKLKASLETKPSAPEQLRDLKSDAPAAEEESSPPESGGTNVVPITPARKDPGF